MNYAIDLCRAGGDGLPCHLSMNDMCCMGNAMEE
jgi:hypothetical protein